MVPPFSCSGTKEACRTHTKLVSHTALVASHNTRGYTITHSILGITCHWLFPYFEVLHTITWYMYRFTALALDTANYLSYYTKVSVLSVRWRHNEAACP